MSAREDIAARLWLNVPSKDNDEAKARTEEMLDRYRAEVRAEVLGSDLNPSNLVLDAQAYRQLADAITATMTDPERWDGDDDEGTILARYVEWLAQGREADERAGCTEPAELMVYRASHDSIVMGRYTTAAEARKHCETELRREWPLSLLDWIEDEEDGVAELVAESADGETFTGYVVTALTVASAYDEEADE